MAEHNRTTDGFIQMARRVFRRSHTSLDVSHSFWRASSLLLWNEKEVKPERKLMNRTGGWERRGGRWEDGER